jgi:hypothetical protein
MLGQLNALLAAAPRVFKRAAPVAALLAAGAVSAGAYSGAATGADHVRSARGTFTLSATPRKNSARPGATVRYTITVHRSHFRRRVKLTLSRTLPAGATARFVLARGRKRRVTLTIQTRSTLKPGRYRLVVRGRSGRLTRRLTLTLTVTSAGAGAASGTAAAGQSPPFTIAGDVTTPLEPGVNQPLDLQITNPNAAPLIVDPVDVAVEAVNAPRATAALPCSLSNFGVQQPSGSLPLTIPAASTRTLSQLGVPPASWPQVALLDLPTDQDGCQGASLTLGYQAAARLG